MKKLSFFTFAMFFAFGLSAQLKQANDAFEHHHYDTAIELYKKAIRKDLDNDKAITNLAICYWKTDQNKLAEYWGFKVFCKRARAYSPLGEDCTLYERIK